MIKRLVFFTSFVLLLLCFVTPSNAAYESRFDAVNYDPAIDASNYFVLFGSRNLTAWQGHAALHFDYANRPLEFRATSGATGRQSVVDNTIIVNAMGAMGFTDWFSMGVNVPVALYNWYYTDDVNAAEDFAASMGDIVVMAKFRALDIDKYRVGLSFIPYATLPSGDVNRYMGNGHVMGGLKMALDFKFHERFEMGLNAGYVMRDDVTRTFNFANGSTSTIQIDDYITFGAGANFKVTRNLQLIAETQGTSQVMHGNFFSMTNTTALEAGAGIRYYIGDSGFALSGYGSAGLIEGVGTPRFRGVLAVSYTSPQTQPCPPCAPDPRIQDNKIIIWGKIFFDTAKATIKQVSFPVLDDVVDVLRTHPEIQLVEIQGHCDWRGSDSYNMGLSQRRSESVRQYLINAGISASRLVAKGYGESQPIASNDTVEGMSQNRRVEFIILRSSGGYTTNPNQAEMSTSQYSPVPEINAPYPPMESSTTVPEQTAFTDDVVAQPTQEPVVQPDANVHQEPLPAQTETVPQSEPVYPDVPESSIPTPAPVPAPSEN